MLQQLNMNPFVLEIVCKDMRMADVALFSLKKNVRLARNNLVRLRAENAKLRAQVFLLVRQLEIIQKDFGAHSAVINTISCAIKCLGN